MNSPLNFRNMAVIVTGGAGMVGGREVRQLPASKAEEVPNVDNQSAHPFNQMHLFGIQLSNPVGFENGTKFDYPRPLREAHRNSDILVHTPLYENFGQTTFGAAAYGLPVICTRVGVVPELIDDRENGIILKANDNPLELARAVNLLLADVDLRRDFGKKIRSKALGLFSWDKVIPAYAKLYQGLA